MFNKVDICGVNTSRLPVLTEAEKEALLAKIKKGDKNAREEFINGNLKLVLSVVQKFAGRGVPDDLFQVGCVGLIKAVDNFDTSQGVRFSTYAVPMIIGEIRRHLRDNNVLRVSRSVRDLAYRAMGERERFSLKRGRDPTDEELAAALGVPVSALCEAMGAVAAPVSLNEPIQSDSGDNLCVMDAIKDESGSEDNWIDGLILKETVKTLTPREKKIIALRFFSGKTQTEAAAEIGISQAQVSRLEKGALEKIKKEL